MKKIYLILFFTSATFSLNSQNKNLNQNVNINYTIKINELETKLKILEIKNDSLQKSFNKVITEDYKSVDIIDKINNYYDNAWNKLIFLLSAIGGILIVILPIILTLQQKRELKLNKLDFEEDVDKKILELERRIIEFNKSEAEKVRQEIGIVNKNITSKQDRDIEKIYAMTYYLQGLYAKTTNNPDLVIKSFITAINSQITVKSDKNIGLCLDNIINAIDKKFNAKSIIPKATLSDLKMIISSIKENFSDKFDEKLSTLNEKIKELK